MSIESAKAFIEKVKNDEDFRKQLNGFADAKQRMAFAKEQGFDFTAEELNKCQEELSDEQLDAVAGGVCGRLCIGGLGDVEIE